MRNQYWYPYRYITYSADSIPVLVQINRYRNTVPVVFLYVPVPVTYCLPGPGLSYMDLILLFDTSLSVMSITGNFCVLSSLQLKIVFYSMSGDEKIIYFFI
jgi:hypothetical protein